MAVAAAYAAVLQDTTKKEPRRSDRRKLAALDEHRALDPTTVAVERCFVGQQQSLAEVEVAPQYSSSC